MSSKNKNLSSVKSAVLISPEKLKVGVIVATWNEEITHPLYLGANDFLLESGLVSENITKLDVPGTFELPVAAKMLLQQFPLDGIICIGCVIKGETSHNEYINHAVANGLTQLSILSGKPCVFGVLTPNSMQQAIERAGGTHGNKGVEAAATLLQMIEIKQGFNKKGNSIGF